MCLGTNGLRGQELLVLSAHRCTCVRAGAACVRNCMITRGVANAMGVRMCAHMRGCACIHVQARWEVGTRACARVYYCVRAARARVCVCVCACVCVLVLVLRTHEVDHRITRIMKSLTEFSWCVELSVRQLVLAMTSCPVCSVGGTPLSILVTREQRAGCLKCIVLSKIAGGAREHGSGKGVAKGAREDERGQQGEHIPEEYGQQTEHGQGERGQPAEQGQQGDQGERGGSGDHGDQGQHEHDDELRRQGGQSHGERNDASSDEDSMTRSWKTYYEARGKRRRHGW